MKHYDYILTINNPCSQDWANMSQNQSECCRYCENCEKKVIDFSDMPDIDILNKIQELPGKICGRFDKEQLDRLLKYTKQSSGNNYVNKIIASLLLFTVVSEEKSLGQNIPIESTIQSEIGKPNCPQIIEFDKTKAKPSKNILEGIILDSLSNNAIPYASIILKDFKIGITADINGYFKWEIPDKFMSDHILIKITSVAFNSEEFHLSKNDFPINKKIFLSQNKNYLMGEVIVTRSPKKNKK